MDYNENQNQNGGGYSDNTQKNWTQQQGVPQRPVVINELEHKKDNMVSTALVLGILGIVFCWVPFIGVIMCLVGLILGIVSVAKTDQHRGLSTAGIICSAVGLILGIFVSIVYVLIV